MFASLQEQFEETKRTLKEVEDNIRRITGRDPDQFNLPVQGTNKWKNGSAPPGNQKILPKKRTLDSRPASEKEEALTPEEEESADEEAPSKKPSLQSTVVATQKDVKTRRDKIEQQKSDSRGMARNRRMFGMILGTLQKFQHEESRRKEQSQKRAEIDKKVEEAAEKEKEEMKREKQELFLTRKEKQIQMRCLEKKLEIAEVHEAWQNQQKMLMNFIKTKAKPHLMFLPSKHNSESQKSLKETQAEIEIALASHNAKFEKELMEIEECYRKDELPDESPGDKENIGPAEEGDSQCVEATELQPPLPQPAEEEEEMQEEENGHVVVNDETSVEVNDRTQDKILETVADQIFEPIYDE